MGHKMLRKNLKGLIKIKANDQIRQLQDGISTVNINKYNKIDCSKSNLGLQTTHIIKNRILNVQIRN